MFVLFGTQVREGLFVEPILNQTCTQSRSILSTFGRDAGQYYTGNNKGGLVLLVLTNLLLVVFILFGMQVREGLFVEPILNQTCTQSRSIISTFGRDTGQYYTGNNQGDCISQQK
jgi:hypothetical protein